MVKKGFFEFQTEKQQKHLQILYFLYFMFFK